MHNVVFSESTEAKVIYYTKNGKAL